MFDGSTSETWFLRSWPQVGVQNDEYGVKKYAYDSALLYSVRISGWHAVIVWKIIGPIFFSKLQIQVSVWALY
jgi:hypothetical protein